MRIKAWLAAAVVAVSVSLFGGGDAKAVGYFAEYQAFYLYVGESGFSDTATFDFANLVYQNAYYRHRVHGGGGEYFWQEWRLEYPGSWYATLLYVNNKIDDLTYLLENNF